MHSPYSHQNLSFISDVAPLPAGLDNTLIESPRNTSIALLPASLVSTRVELLASPRCAGSLSLIFAYLFFIFHFFHFQRTVHRHLFISEVEEGSQLIESRRGCPFREVFYVYL